jgi:hypothetical protein
LETLKIYQKWEDMTAYLYIALRSYPKSERFTLAAETARATFDLGTAITRANAVTAGKRRWIEQADVELARLKVLIRIGMRLEFLAMKKYENLSRMQTEIGRMIGGWLKAA